MAERNESEDGRRANQARVPWSHRGPEDDFLCLRYRVWYPSRDCAIRTKFATSPGCSHCDQGRFNLKRHAVALRAIRMRIVADGA